MLSRRSASIAASACVGVLSAVLLTSCAASSSTKSGVVPVESVSPTITVGPSTVSHLRQLGIDDAAGAGESTPGLNWFIATRGSLATATGWGAQPGVDPMQQQIVLYMTGAFVASHGGAPQPPSDASAVPRSAQSARAPAGTTYLIAFDPITLTPTDSALGTFDKAVFEGVALTGIHSLK